ncbi:aldo-keto reductase 1B-like [Amphiura filiformis]|uniref:aldo-keto reductase 1B-like n=1 Tax=Amphiura filiformis TaxID=82378 RepID=UPI003B21F598
MAAIDSGYRHIDGAFAYQNEHEVGDAIQTKINEGKITREDIFYTSKSGDNFWPLGDDGKLIFEDIDYVDTWKAMEPLVEKGLCKAIGVSNFPIEFMKRILNINKVPVSNLQVEAHPYLPQHELVDFCKKKGITVTAYSPLGSPDRPTRTKEDPVLMEDPVVKAIAESKGKSPAQILVKFNLQRGLICIPKSVTPSRIQSNYETLDFELTESELNQLLQISRNCRFVTFPP